MLLWSIFTSPEQAPLPPQVVDYKPLLSTNQALELTQSLLSAKSPEDLSELIRPGTLNPQQAYEFIQDLRMPDGSEPNTTWLGTVDSLSVPIESLTVQYEDNPYRMTLLTPDANGDWKIDFDAFAQLCVPNFKEFLDGSGSEGLIRVRVIEDNYFNGVFSDELKWKCYILSHSKDENSLFGYCERGSKAHAALEVIEKRLIDHTTEPGAELSDIMKRTSSTSSRVTLRIKRPAEAELRQFEITDVIADDWLISDIPFDERITKPQ